MLGPNFGNRLGALKLTCPGGGAACAPAAATNSPAIITRAEVATMASRHLPLTSTAPEHNPPADFNPPADKRTRLADEGRRHGREAPRSHHPALRPLPSTSLAPGRP